MNKILITSLAIVTAVVVLLGFNDPEKTIDVTKKPCETVSQVKQPVRFILNTDIGNNLTRKRSGFAYIKAVDPSNKEIVFDKVKVSIEEGVIKSEVIYLKTGKYKVTKFEIVSEGNPASGIPVSYHYPINTTQAFSIKLNNFLAC